MTTDALPDQLRALHALATRITGDPKSPFYVPGIVVAIARGNETVARLVTGTDAGGTPLREDTLFPLASASKLAPGIAILRLVDDGRIALDDPLSQYLPEALAAQPGVTIRALLSHTSGLPLEFRPGQVEYGPALSWGTMAPACLHTPLTHPPGTRVQYSNIAYGLLGIIIERLTGLDYRTAVERLVFHPLGVEAYIGRPGPRPHAVIMDVDSAFAGTDLEPFNSAFSQHLTMPWSSVVATPEALLALVQVYADSRPALVRSETTAQARSDQTHGLEGGFGTSDAFIGFNKSKSITWPHCAWGLTVEVRGDKRPHWTPTSARPESFGHIGSSGCLAWCDPTRRVSWAVLGSRTTDNGWMLRYGGAIGNIALAIAGEDG